MINQLFMYLFEGLPPDITSEEFVEIMSKCGIVMRDPITEEYKVKLYKDREGNLKGDGLCCYLKVSRCFCCVVVNFCSHYAVFIIIITMAIRQNEP